MNLVGFLKIEKPTYSYETVGVATRNLQMCFYCIGHVKNEKKL